MLILNSFSNFSAKEFGSFVGKHYICTKLVKHRHSFLNGYGRLRTAFLLYCKTNMAHRVTFYIDGFNFYYGLRRTKRNEPQWGDYYWIDLVKLCSSFLGEGQQLEKVVYFTASPLNPEKSSRQSAFLNANKLLNGDRFEIVRGKYLEKQIQCPNCHYAISRPEEKKTDVNISVRMLGDCVLNATDVIVLVSADSDLVPPLEFIQKHYPDKRIKVYFPPSNFSCDLRDNLFHHSSKPVLLYKNEHRFREAVMSDVVTDGIKQYEIPEKWIPNNIVR